MSTVKIEINLSRDLWAKVTAHTEALDDVTPMDWIRAVVAQAAAKPVPSSTKAHSMWPFIRGQVAR